ncbi:nitrate reductase molybdenum cofactor assembly chaperone [Virgibacillus sp. 179-BFC.A HS]|uniref:Nitrate reductase molybdenum cofactor assembly chaperone n=1 Tax=Tigheibacillus jepli TaxID=3035914 RepID=A0ABU5CIU5_9BACI|nr:nitrate reductase molybdenum cofactor assembly chaperone [Virgibacillus sp. 179-BFC.A HS]MDY0405762.1 nitrate reductase molybdenum cofactor assembly chaperone [Virgibacillus sp. 179-BFC.A HS]
MDQQTRALLLIASRLLAYPDEDFAELKEEVIDYANENFTSDKLKLEIISVMGHLSGYTLSDLRVIYVQTFDLKSKHGLYLTAHELGDSNKRGAALIKLQRIISQAGYERIDDDLADYMPMLFEFLSVAADSKETERLVRRLAVAISRILQFLPPENEYYPILFILMEHVFPAPSREEKEKLEFDREEADLEELPYPIMYH